MTFVREMEIKIILLLLLKNEIKSYLTFLWQKFERNIFFIFKQKNRVVKITDCKKNSITLTNGYAFIRRLNLQKPFSIKLKIDKRLPKFFDSSIN